MSAVVVNKGAPEAGAIYLLITIDRDKVHVLAPPPGPAHNEQGDKIWVRPLGDEPVSPEKAQEYIIRQRSYDPDIWVIDIDDKTGKGGLEPGQIR